MKRTCFVLCMVGILAAPVSAQVRPKPKPKKPPVQTSAKTPTTYLLGAATEFNGITGGAFEMVIKTKSSGPSRSTVSVVGGYDSRYTTFKINGLGDTERHWVHGAGGEVLLNNYLEKYREGPFWSIGAGGHYYFIKPNAQHYLLTQEPFFRPRSNLKLFSVAARVGYRLNEEKFLLSPFIGGSLAGTPLRSTTRSKLNGFSVKLGFTIMIKP